MNSLPSTALAETLSFFDFQPAPGVVEFLEKNVEVPERVSPTQPGRFSTLQRPYMREPLECFQPKEGITDLWLPWGSQAGKTTVTAMGVAYLIENDPGPVLWVTPSENFGRSWSSTRWMPLIEHNPILAQHMPGNADDWKHLEQHYDRMTMNVVGSNSPANLASRPARYVVCDEVCKFAKATADEASAMMLADQRTKTFREMAMRIRTSTPTTAEDEFWLGCKGADMRQNHIPCPSCKKPIVLNHVLMDQPDDLEALRSSPEDSEFTLHWDKEKARLDDGTWDEQIVQQTAHFRCVHCEYPICDHEKPSLLLLGEWHPLHAGKAKNTRSYQLSSFYSPDVTFGQMATHFLKGKNLFGLQDYTNGWLGLPYHESLLEVSDADIMALRSDYRLETIPKDAQITAILIGVDPGERETHWTVTVHSLTGEMWLIDHGTVLDVSDLTELQKRTWPIGSTGRRRAATGGFIDSGYNTTKVYDFCRGSQGFFHPTKGSKAAIGTWSMTPVRSHPGITLLTYVDFTAKCGLYEDRVAKRGNPRFYLPDDIGREFCRGFSSQKKLQKRTERGTVYFWKKVEDDHYPDCVKVADIGFKAMTAGLN